MTRLQADLLLLLTAALWGFAFVMQKSAMTSVAPLTFIAARAAVSMVVLAPLAMWEARQTMRRLPAKFYALTAVAALIFTCGSALQQTGLMTATVTSASFLTALYAVCTPFAVWIIFRAPPAAIVWPAAALSLVGVWLLGGATVGALSVGDSLVVLSAPLWAVHIILTGLAAQAGRPFLFTAVQFAAVATLAAVAAVSFETPSLALLADAGWEIAYVGLISTALTFTLFVIAMRHAPPAEAAIILSTENLFASLAGALVLGERLGLINWLGAIVIVAAVLLVQTSAYRQQPSSGGPAVEP